MRSGPMGISELKVGMVLPGTVRSLTSFGAFVDIGVGQDGLLHSKHIDPSRSLIVGAGSTIHVTILDVDSHRKRISLGFGEVDAVGTNKRSSTNKSRHASVQRQQKGNRKFKRSTTDAVSSESGAGRNSSQALRPTVDLTKSLQNNGRKKSLESRVASRMKKPIKNNHRTSNMKTNQKYTLDERISMRRQGFNKNKHSTGRKRSREESQRAGSSSSKRSRQ